MKENIKRVINITNIFGFSISWTYIIIISFLYPAITGAIFGLLNHTTYSGMVEFIFLFSIPGLFLAMFGKLIFPKAKLKHIFLSSSLGVFIYSSLFLLFYFVATSISLQWLEGAIVISGFFSSLIWYIVGSVFFKSPRRALVFALLQFVVYVSYISFFTYTNAVELNIKFFFAGLVFIIATGLTYYLISLPIKRNFGYSGLEMLRMFFAQWLYKEKDLESAFSTISQKANLDTSIFYFKDENKKISSLVIPSIHYGPFGMLCSSNFPAVLKKSIPGATALHSTSTHDLNLSNSQEKLKLIKMIETMQKKKKTFSNKFSFSFGLSENKKAKANLLVFGDNALLLLTRSPYTTEDIDYSLGYILKEKLKPSFKNVAVADMHNSEGKDITYFSAYSKEGKEYISAVDDLLRKKLKFKKLKFSYRHIPKNLLKNRTLGNAGITIYSFDWEEPIVMVIVDGNAIKRKCKVAIESRIKKLAPSSKVFVLTTDSHEINAVKGVVNEYSCSKEEVKRIVDNAIHTLKNMKEGYTSFKNFSMDLKILGKDFSVELISTLNSSIAIAKILIPLGLILSIFLSFYILYLI